MRANFGWLFESTLDERRRDDVEKGQTEKLSSLEWKIKRRIVVFRDTNYETRLTSFSPRLHQTTSGFSSQTVRFLVNSILIL